MRGKEGAQHHLTTRIRPRRFTPLLAAQLRELIVEVRIRLARAKQVRASFGRDLILVEVTVGEAERPVALLGYRLVVGDDYDGGVVRVGEGA